VRTRSPVCSKPLLWRSLKQKKTSDNLASEIAKHLEKDGHKLIKLHDRAVRLFDWQGRCAVRSSATHPLFAIYVRSADVALLDNRGKAAGK